MILPRIRILLLTGLALCSTACLPIFSKVPGAKKLSAPKSGPKTQAFQKNYCGESRGSLPPLRPGTPLSTLLWDDECGSGMTTCATGLDAVKGSLPGPYTQVFVDLLDASTTEGGAPDFVYETCDITSAVPPYLLGIEGLGFAHAHQHQAALTDFAVRYGGKNFNDSSTQRTLVRALFLTGKSEAAEDALRSLLDEHPQADTYKPEILKYLAAWDSSVAVDACMETLKSGKGPIEACIWYLGERRHAEAQPLIVRRMEDEKVTAARALGQLGDPQSVPVLEAVLEKTHDESLRTAAVVALINLGREDLFTEYERQLRGQKGSRVDVRMIETATIDALTLDDAALRARAFDVVEGLGDLGGTSNAWRVPVVLAAARASTGDAEAVAAVTAMLDDPSKDVRHLVVGSIGGNFEQLRGLRVPDRSLLGPLARAYALEPSAQYKPGIIWAAAFIAAD